MDPQATKHFTAMQKLQSKQHGMVQELSMAKKYCQSKQHSMAQQHSMVKV